MTSLESSLDGLLAFLANQGFVVPTTEIWLVEIASNADVDQRGRLRVRRREFMSPEEYSRRFDELLETGIPWINISCCGLYERRLLVLIEAPRAPSIRPGRRASINYSGPTRATCERGWDVSDVLAIT